MRDFRVTTIFEGTTEIHSIYPALFVLRILSKRLQAKASGRLPQVITLVKKMFGPTRWPITFDDKIMNRALRFAKASVRRMRLMILVGFMIYGESITRKEFFLRRITTLSLYVYGIIVVLAKLEVARKSGRPINTELNILAYFLEEARQARKLNQRVFSTRQERLHRKITSEIVSGLRGSDVSRDSN
jgi:acyl-CoA dehydrogenase family protein 9